MARFSSASKVASISKRKASAALHNDFTAQLKDLCRAGKELAKTFATLGRHTDSKERFIAYDNHREETRNHVQRLDNVIELLGKKAAVKRGEKLHVVAGSVLSKPVFETSINTGTTTNLPSQKSDHLALATYSSIKEVTGVINMKEWVGLKEEKIG